jgi:hypothetical protein
MLWHRARRGGYGRGRLGWASGGVFDEVGLGKFWRALRAGQRRIEQSLAPVQSLTRNRLCA